MARTYTKPSRTEQRRRACLSKPGKKTEPAVEGARREAAYQLGSKLSLDLLEMMAGRVARDRKAQVVIDEILSGARPGGGNEIAALAALQMTNMDLSAFNRDVQDRFGAMRRTQTDVTLEHAKPAVLEVNLGWPAQGGRDADAVDVAVAAAGAAHGHGAPVH